MMEDIHIADGIAVKLLLAGLVLAGATVGALALDPGVAAGGPTEVSSAQLAFPIDNVTASAGAQLLSLDGKGDDPLTAFSIDDAAAAFPIDNVTRTRVSAGVSSDVSAVIRDVEPFALSFGQDMDPYALGQDMDPYALSLGQDMDPY